MHKIPNESVTQRIELGWLARRSYGLQRSFIRAWSHYD